MFSMIRFHLHLHGCVCGFSETFVSRLGDSGEEHMVQYPPIEHPGWDIIVAGVGQDLNNFLYLFWRQFCSNRQPRLSSCIVWFQYCWQKSRAKFGNQGRIGCALERDAVMQHTSGSFTRIYSHPLQHDI
jgi:hypothetical protein